MCTDENCIQENVSGKMKRRICISSDDDDDGNSRSGSMPSWAGKNTKLDTLLERLIDSVLLINNKVERLSNRVTALEEKVNQEIMLGRNERTEFMNEVKSEIAELKKSQEEEQPVFVGSHLVSKLSNLQKLVKNGLPVDDASDSEGGWSPWHDLDVRQVNHGNRDLNSWDKYVNVQIPNEELSSGGWKPWTSHLDVQQPNGWASQLNVQQPNGEDHWRPPGGNVTKLNVVGDNQSGSQSSSPQPVACESCGCGDRCNISEGMGKHCKGCGWIGCECSISKGMRIHCEACGCSGHIQMGRPVK